MMDAINARAALVHTFHAPLCHDCQDRHDVTEICWPVRRQMRARPQTPAAVVTRPGPPPAVLQTRPAADDLDAWVTYWSWDAICARAGYDPPVPVPRRRGFLLNMWDGLVNAFEVLAGLCR